MTHTVLTYIQSVWKYIYVYVYMCTCVENVTSVASPLDGWLIGAVGDDEVNCQPLALNAAHMPATTSTVCVYASIEGHHYIAGVEGHMCTYKYMYVPQQHTCTCTCISAIKEISACYVVCPTTRSSTGKVIETSVGILAEYAQQLMELIFSSVEQCPGLLRMALRQLWARVAERFTGPEHTVREQ